MTNKIIPFSFDEVRIGDRIYYKNIFFGYVVECEVDELGLCICCDPSDDAEEYLNLYVSEEYKNYRIDRRSRIVRLFYPFKIPNDYK